jgi:DNA-binding MarR family transcriptional regulator
VDAASGLTAARLSALSVLVFGGPRSLGGLAHAESVAGPTMTRIVDGLVERGLARRDPHPSGARSVLVTATAEGERLMRAAARRRVEAIATALEALPREDQEVLGAAGPLLDALAAEVRE